MRCCNYRFGLIDFKRNLHIFKEGVKSSGRVCVPYKLGVFETRVNRLLLGKLAALSITSSLSGEIAVMRKLINSKKLKTFFSNFQNL